MKGEKGGWEAWQKTCSKDTDLRMEAQGKDGPKGTGQGPLQPQVPNWGSSLHWKPFLFRWPRGLWILQSEAMAFPALPPGVRSGGVGDVTSVWGNSPGWWPPMLTGWGRQYNTTSPTLACQGKQLLGDLRYFLLCQFHCNSGSFLLGSVQCETWAMSGHQGGARSTGQGQETETLRLAISGLKKPRSFSLLTSCKLAN